MNMSYKRAWDLVDEINRICGVMRSHVRWAALAEESALDTADLHAAHSHGANSIGALSKRNRSALRSGVPQR
jgi:hypothetical protein